MINNDRTYSETANAHAIQDVISDLTRYHQYEENDLPVNPVAGYSTVNRHISSNGSLPNLMELTAHVMTNEMLLTTSVHEHKTFENLWIVMIITAPDPRLAESMTLLSSPCKRKNTTCWIYDLGNNFKNVTINNGMKLSNAEEYFLVSSERVDYTSEGIGFHYCNAGEIYFTLP